MLLACAGPSGAAAASSVAAGGGYDYQSGPNGATWRAPLVFATAVSGGRDATLSLSRYDSSDVGWGWTGAANVGLSFGSRVGARAIASRAVGDGDYRSWQAQAGPTFQFGGGRSLFAYATHFEDDQGARLTQVGAEGSFPLGAQFSGTAGSAVGARQGGDTSAQGTVGLTWSPRKWLAVVGQTSVGKNIVASSTGAGGGGGAATSIGPRGRGRMGQTTTETSSGLESTTLLALRIAVP